MIIAAAAGRVQALERLLESGADMQATNNVSAQLHAHIYPLCSSHNVQQGQTALDVVDNSDLDKAMEIIATWLKYAADIPVVSQVGITCSTCNTLSSDQRKGCGGNTSSACESVDGW